MPELKGCHTKQNSLMSEVKIKRSYTALSGGMERNFQRRNSLGVKKVAAQSKLPALSDKELLRCSRKHITLEKWKNL
ncbi:MAG: hypothetical protein N2257_10255 [Thermodesulfovibrionales bacterium]|nr:hypothetical protein [Thermodesulfovibrionales bacterium]